VTSCCQLEWQRSSHGGARWLRAQPYRVVRGGTRARTGQGIAHHSNSARGAESIYNMPSCTGSRCDIGTDDGVIESESDCGWMFRVTHHPFTAVLQL